MSRTSAALTRRGLTFLAAAVCFVTMVAPPSQAADVVELGFASVPRDSSLEDLLYLAIGIELSRAGFSSSRVVGSGTLLLTAAYEERGTEVKLNLTLFRTTAVNSLATTDVSVSMDDKFEETVGLTVRALLSQAGLLNPDSTAAGAGPETTMEGLLLERPPASEVSLPTVASIYVESFVGGSAFLGKLADLTRYGLGAGLSGGMQWLADTWSLRVGARAGTSRAINNKSISGGPLYLTSAGLEADWGTGRRSPYRLWGGGSAGVLVLTLAGNDVRSKTVFCADGGTGVLIPMGYGFSWGGELRLQAAFESTLILAFSPAITLSKEF